MSAGKQNLLISKKASFDFTFYVLDVYDKTKLPNDPAQTPVNLTGATGVAKARAKITDTSPLFSFTVAFPNPTLGEVKLSLTAAQTSSMDFAKGVWDILITFPDGTVKKYLEGNVVLDLTAS